jgi:glycerol kinase
MRIAAIDQGTTSTRLLLAGSDVSPHVVRRLDHEQHYPNSGWVEHDPRELLANVAACLDAAGPVDAIGLANQGESCLAWNAQTGEAVSPVIVWQDSRTAEMIKRLKAEGAEELTLSRAGLPLDSYFAASKLRWILDHEPAARNLLAAGRLRLGTTDAFFLDRLTGRFVTDATTASRTSLLNMTTGFWDIDLCALFGIPPETLPTIVPTIADFGVVTNGPLVASLVDQQASLWGHGCRRSGDLKITFGTGAFALAITGDAICRAPEKGILPTIAWQFGGVRTYAVDAGVYNAGSAVDWIRRLGLADVDQLGALERPPAIDRDLIFVPALSGLACPHWDRSAAGLWLGLSLDTDRSDLCQALLEGVALRTAEAVTAIASEIPLSDPVAIDGGLSRSPYFVKILASVLGLTVKVSDFDEMTAFGAASLAARTTGIDLPPPRSAERIVAPCFAAGGWRERFADGVARARNWRRTEGQDQ